MRNHWLYILFCSLILSGCVPYYTYNNEKFDTPDKALASQAKMYEEIMTSIGVSSSQFPELLYIVLPKRNEIDSRGIIKRGNPDPIILKYIGDTIERDNAWMAKILASYELFSSTETGSRYPLEPEGLVLIVDYNYVHDSPWVLSTSDMLETRQIRFDVTANTPLARVKSWLNNMEKEARYLTAYLAKKPNKEPKDSSSSSTIQSLEKTKQNDSVVVGTGTGHWKVSTSINPLDDTKTIILALPAKKGRSGRSDRPIPLIIRCKSGETELYIGWGEYLGSSTHVTSRLGHGQAITSQWNLSSESTTSFYPHNTILFINQLMNVDRLVLQTTPYQEIPITAVFETTGLKTAIKPLRMVCGW